MNSSEKELVALLREEKRVTPRYAAAKVGKQQPYVSQLLAGLVDDGYAEKVDRGLYAVGPEADGDESGESGGETESAPTPRQEEREPARPPGESATAVDDSGVPITETTLQEMTDELVAQLDLPGRGTRLDARREAIADMYRHILREGQATKEELRQYVDADAVGYDTGESFFSNVVRGGSGPKYSAVFGTLPGVERPAKGGKDYRRKP
jgi:hypothetical protein